MRGMKMLPSRRHRQRRRRAGFHFRLNRIFLDTRRRIRRRRQTRGYNSIEIPGCDVPLGAVRNDLNRFILSGDSD